MKVRHGAFYFITFISNFTYFGHAYLISYKYKAIECFRYCTNEVENQMDRTKLDRGCEYLLDQFKNLCNEKGIIRQLTIPHTAQQNGISERRNKILLNTTRSMMTQANLSISFRKDTLLIATYIQNKMPSKLVASTPYKLWSSRKLDLSNLTPWGSTTYIYDSTNKYENLCPLGKNYIFIRYSKQPKGYMLICEQDYGSITKIA